MTEIDLDLLDPETIKKVEQLAAAKGVTTDFILTEALDCYAAEFKIGDRLLTHLDMLAETAGAATKKAIKHWQDRIQTKIDQIEEGEFGKND